ncbi:MAG: M24 family metallopeptidase [Planctomycetota bacterium]
MQVPSDALAARRRRAAESLDLGDAVLLVGAGSPIPVPGGMDQVHPFAPHPHYQWLAGHRSPGGVVAFDPRSNEWRDFSPAVTMDDTVWEGRTESFGEPLEGLAPWLEARKDRAVAVLGVPVDGFAYDRDVSESLEPALLAARRAKDAHEIEVIRRACAATARGFTAAKNAIAQPNATERSIEVDLTLACLRAGGHGMGYHTIVGTGSNAAILHFSAGDRIARDGEFVLIDAGCHIDGYTADVSRTFVKGTPTQQHRDLYAIVLEAERFALEHCKPGQEFRALHLQTAAKLAEGLVHLGILRGDPAGLVERDAHANFFPHGLGHLVGLGVRDASGYLPGRERSDRFGLAFLRMDLPLEAGMVTTVEPGLYFIEPLLAQPDRRERFADCTAWDAVDRWLHIGGVRIEDDVLVTDAEPVNLTAEIDKSFESMMVS